MTKFVYFVVYFKVLFDIGIRAGNVRLRLIVVVIGHEKFHAVMGKKLAHFVAKLRRQRLVVRQNKRRTLDVFLLCWPW